MTYYIASMYSGNEIVFLISRKKFLTCLKNEIWFNFSIHKLCVQFFGNLSTDAFDLIYLKEQVDSRNK